MDTLLNNLTRIQNAVAEIKSAINEKGINVGTGDRIDTLSEKIRSISIPAGENGVEPNPEYSIPAGG